MGGMALLYLAGRCPSGQREQTVNLPAAPTGVRIPPDPLPGQRAFLGVMPHYASSCRALTVPSRLRFERASKRDAASDALSGIRCP